MPSRVRNRLGTQNRPLFWALAMHDLLCCNMLCGTLSRNSPAATKKGVVVPCSGERPKALLSPGVTVAEWLSEGTHQKT